MEEVRIYFKGLKMNHLTDNNAYPKEGVNSQGSAGRRSKDITIITMFNEVWNVYLHWNGKDIFNDNTF